MSRVASGSSVFGRPIQGRYARLTREPLIDDDGDVRELSLEDMQAMRPAAEVLPPELLALLPKRPPGERGKGRRAAKEAVTLRLDPEVIHHFRAGGPGWQSRINKVLRGLHRHRVLNETFLVLGDCPVAALGQASMVAFPCRSRAS
ncbi:MAG: BrnA antitoxin family protein [Rhizobiaceae bacterium]|nr:BrnA antitoxin family protein [Rhizobiaceae bacterium]